MLDSSIGYPREESFSLVMTRINSIINTSCLCLIQTTDGMH
jgi:hypothetical protein